MTEKRILLIEDEPAIADALQFVLQREGFVVHWHALARAGEAAWQQDGAALVVLDVGLPDDSGFEVLKRIRRMSETQPVLLLTARAEEVDRILGLELGADDYVVKPFSPREVAARVKAILKRSQPASAAGLVPAAAVAPVQPAGEAVFEHDVAGLRIRYHGQWLALTPSEYRLLAHLLGQPGRVYSRAQLLDALGDAAEDSLERTIDSHIRSLRAKLRQTHPAHDPVVTHRGFGYALELA